jgi:hypothetical protein
MHIIFCICGHGFSQYREPETKAQRTVVDAWKIPGMNPNVLQDSHNCETLPASSRSRSEASTVYRHRAILERSYIVSFNGQLPKNFPIVAIRRGFVIMWKVDVNKIGTDESVSPVGLPSW